MRTIKNQTPSNVIIKDSELKEIISAKSARPHDFLGMHKCKGGYVVRAYLINAKACAAVDVKTGEAFAMEKLDPSGFFEVFLPRKRKSFAYMLKIDGFGGETRQIYDPYSFLPTLSEDDLYLFGEGREYRVYDKLGSQIRECASVRGVSFAVWAPTARRVSVVGEFNEWDGRYNPMRPLGASGIWEIFIPHVGAGAKYKFEILPAHSDTPFLKADPYAMFFEPPPYNSSIVADISDFEWNDASWLESRAATDLKKEPMSVYEVHLGSWKRKAEDGNRPLSYVEIANDLSDYCKRMNFTHVEFLPLAEFPFDGSWGYQVTGFYAPTHRFGTPKDFMRMVDIFHSNGIGVIIDWVPAHFPRDAFALATFDGSCLYEHQDPRQGAHQEWGTLVFNYGRNEVRNFLTGSALAWLERFHVDGLRVDAVASMLYLDYARKAGEWIPNRFGGNENLEAVAFLKEVNAAIHKYHPGAITIAEESTAFVGVTKPVEEGGLGFDFKWNMGWMHDTISYFNEDPINRKYHHNAITFPAIYQFTENFISVYSHDEVVHGKGSMVNKMGCAYWNDKLANLRALYAYMWMWPGKKTLFMGSEFGQSREWRYDGQLDWELLQYPQHSGVREVVKDAAKIYLSDSSLAAGDFDPRCFAWINWEDGLNSVIAFERRTADGQTSYAVICNFTPVERRAYAVGLPYGGKWAEILNTNAAFYGGSGSGNGGEVRAEKSPLNGREFSAKIVLPPLATIVLKHVKK